MTTTVDSADITVSCSKREASGPTRQPLSNRKVRLSRFAIIRPQGANFVLESALGGEAFVLRSPAIFSLLQKFGNPVDVSALVSSLPEAQRSAISELIERCRKANLLVNCEDDGTAEEDKNSLAHWEWHDLAFHTASRMGRNRSPIGANWRLRGVVAAEPTIGVYDRIANIPLARYDPNGQDWTEIPLQQVLEQRRSLYSFQPLTIEALGAFLYRTCRVTAQTGSAGEATLRKVHPSGGSLHPLEIYVIAADCYGLNPGLYHYQASKHALSAIRGLDRHVEEILFDARRSAAGLPKHPPILLVVTARFRRTAWKYQSIAYRLILLEVGALYQTMYLVATAMNLAPCALGCGNSELFSTLVNTDYFMETSVGEFMLASQAAEAQP
jgi:SagB-type dehydrogenase family enzyme